MYDYLNEIHGQVEAKEAMEFHYEELQRADNTFDRKEHCSIMLKIYNKYACVRKIWDYIENAFLYIKRFVKKIERLLTHEEHDYFYLMRFFTNDDRFCFYKIGSSVHPDIRLTQHEANYGYTGEIIFTIDTGDVAASSLEDKVRSYFIRKYGKENYLPKDRFLCEVDIEDIKSKIPTCIKALRAAEIY